MIKEFNKSIGYVCPTCSTINIKDVNLFDFSGSGKTDFGCTNSVCSSPCFSVTPKKDKYSITVYCPICDEPHLFNIKKVTFWRNDFFVLHCPESGFGILFIGESDKIREEIARQEKLFGELGEEFTIGDDLSILFETVEHINKLAKNDAIFCSCESRNIAIEIDNDSITLSCRDCGRKKRFLTNREALEELLKSGTIVLE